MSAKSKKSTADKTNRNEHENHLISYSASKISNRLSLSFYGEDTLKKQKQVILDNYDEVHNSEPACRRDIKTYSYSKKKLVKPKTPTIRIKQESNSRPVKYF